VTKIDSSKFYNCEKSVNLKTFPLYVGYNMATSNGNDIETKANKSFDNGVFFDIEGKGTCSIVRKLFLKRSKHIR
jgi:hypothetical protein